MSMTQSSNAMDIVIALISLIFEGIVTFLSLHITLRFASVPVAIAISVFISDTDVLSSKLFLLQDI